MLREEAEIHDFTGRGWLLAALTTLVPALQEVSSAAVETLQPVVLGVVGAFRTTLTAVQSTSRVYGALMVEAVISDVFEGCELFSW